MKPLIVFRRLTELDLDEAVEVFNLRLGSSYITREELEASIIDKTKTVNIAVDATSGKIVGVVILASFLNVKQFSKTLPEGMISSTFSLMPDIEGTTGRIGLLKSVAVLPDFCGQGIGSNLVRSGLKFLKDGSVETVLSFGWLDDKGCHIQGSLERNGFKALGDVADFWKEDSSSRGYFCPTCGSPCSCVARIFFKRI